MPPPLRPQTRKLAHERAKSEFDVQQGDLYVKADGAYWGPIACNPHRTHETRIVRRVSVNNDTGVASEWDEPVLHQTGEEVPDEDGKGLTPKRVADGGYPGYQPGCDDCADHVWDTMDYLKRVRSEIERAQ